MNKTCLAVAAFVGLFAVAPSWSNPLPVPLPTVSGRSVYLSQVGDSNRAEISQESPNALTSIRQNGNSNEGRVNQFGSAPAYAEVEQEGDLNLAALEQGGEGANAILLVQTGNGNSATVSQLALGSIGNSARLSQTGDNNNILLQQAGDDNVAQLTQNGNDNSISATQLGEGNRLSWTQNGDGLSNLGITQTGGGQQDGQLVIVQSNIGFAH